MEKDKQYQEMQKNKEQLVECLKENAHLKTQNEELKRNNIN